MSNFKTGFYFNFSRKALCCAVLVAIAWWYGSVALIEIFSDFSSQWPWLLAAVLYAVIPTEMFMHLIISHRMFTVDHSRITYKILTFITNTQMTMGTSTGFAIMHPGHHVYSDQPGKDHAYFDNWWQNFLYYSAGPLMFLLNPKFSLPESYYQKQQEKNQDTIDDVWTWVCTEYNVALTVIYWTILWFTFPEFLFKIVLASRVIFSFGNLMSSHYFDWAGYRNFNTNDNSTNHLIVHYLFLCINPTFLHNNHHAVDLKQGHRVKWYEFDLAYPTIKYILKPLLSPRPK